MHWLHQDSNPEHAYVALMYKISHCYASWDPLRPVKVGDYGYLQNNYSFHGSGNIFDEDDPKHDLAIQYHCSTARQRIEGTIWQQSSVHEERKAKVDAAVSHLPVFGGKLKKSFTISHDYGAMLCMINPHKITLVHKGGLQDIVNDDKFGDELVLITEAWTCNSFARLLAPHQKRTVDISIDATVHAKLAHGKADVRWETNAEGGHFIDAYGEEGDEETKAYPLFTLAGRKHHHRFLDHLLHPRHAHDMPITMEFDDTKHAPHILKH